MPSLGSPIWVHVLGSRENHQQTRQIVAELYRYSIEVENVDRRVAPWSLPLWRVLPNENFFILFMAAERSVDRISYIALSQALSLYRARRIHLIVIFVGDTDGENGKVTAADDRWRQQWQLLFAELLALHHRQGYRVPASAGISEWISTAAAAVRAHAATALQSIEAGPATVFFSYSHRDEGLRDALHRHLSMLERNGLIKTWHDREISAGDDWARAIQTRLYTCDLILLLLSADFFASDYCADVELAVALERHWSQSACAIPVILRPVLWQHSPLGRLQALPKDGIPVTEWESRDAALVNICEGILTRLMLWKGDVVPREQ